MKFRCRSSHPLILLPVFVILAMTVNFLPSIFKFKDSPSAAYSLINRSFRSQPKMSRPKLIGINAEDPRSVSTSKKPKHSEIGEKVVVKTTIKKSMFPKDFIWGTATAAYQVEGAYNEGGRGLSIWDTFSKIPGKVANGDNGDVACDQYHKYEEDVKLMADCGFKSYRFSISWSRIIPDGDGEINKEGIDYYNRLIDALLKKGLIPFVTLYHWDLPQALEDKYNGWLDARAIASFARYAEVCYAAFGDRVQHWITFNEPLTFTSIGYGWGIFAPGRCSDREMCPQGDSAREPYIAAHNVLLSHAMAVKVYRDRFQASQKGVIGITVDSDWSEPGSDSDADMAAAQRRMEFNFGWFLDPIFFGDYPGVMREHVGTRLPEFSGADRAVLVGSVDFVGINHYTTRWVTNGKPPSSENESNMFFDQWVECSASKGDEVIGERAASDWLYIVPWGFEKLLLWVHNRYNPSSIFISENGMDDENDPSVPLRDALNDTTRVQFYNDYLHSVERARKQGVKVDGYFAWSFMDNFEWAMGYSRRFGIHFVDFKDGLKRYPKLSAHWWKEFLSEESEAV